MDSGSRPNSQWSVPLTRTRHRSTKQRSGATKLLTHFLLRKPMTTQRRTRLALQVPNVRFGLTQGDARTPPTFPEKESRLEDEDALSQQPRLASWSNWVVLSCRSIDRYSRKRIGRIGIGVAYDAKKRLEPACCPVQARSFQRQ